MVTLIRLSAFAGENCKPLYIKGLDPEEDARRDVKYMQDWFKEYCEVDLLGSQEALIEYILKSRRNPGLY